MTQKIQASQNDDTSFVSLKPCPFCGGEPHIEVIFMDGRCIVCGACGASTDEYQGEEKAKAAWDTRFVLVPDDTRP